MSSPERKKSPPNTIEFEKIFNRSMPLLNIEYWYQGENKGLAQLTEQSMCFNPLFLYEKNKGVDVYYDLDCETNDRILISYFKTHPKKFELLVDNYKTDCDKLMQLSQKATTCDIATIFKLLVLFWPKMATIFSLGKLTKDNDSKSIYRHAYNLRQKTEKVEYLSNTNLMRLVNKSLPDLKKYTDVLTFEEIINKDIPNIKELKRRKERFSYFEGKLYTNLSIEQLEKLKNIKIINVNLSDNKKYKKILKGKVAMRGKAKGKVTIVFETDQLDKVKKGDILVTPMTTPDYIMAMGKAAAFITDEGGITCHAAIVAREMGKPCITGTKVATSVLHEGDLVEVDAYKGTVKKYNSPKTKF